MRLIKLKILVCNRQLSHPIMCCILSVYKSLITVMAYKNFYACSYTCILHNVARFAIQFRVWASFLHSPYTTGCQGCRFRCGQSKSSIRSYDRRNWDISVDGSWGMFIEAPRLLVFMGSYYHVYWTQTTDCILPLYVLTG